ncbi:MAG: hypothetical protein KDB00_25670 [Planctomycetales bacterium]|nr:hypothetical protein [Planctomycetales bacterium]
MQSNTCKWPLAVLSGILLFAATLSTPGQWTLSAVAGRPCCCVKECTCEGNGMVGGKAAEPQLPTQPIRVSPLAQQLRPNRVLVITPLDRQDRLKEQVTLMRQLATELRGKSGFDVIECSQRACEDMFPIRTGQFDERKLVSLGRQYMADTILYCNIESIDAYSPMRLEIQYLLVNIDQSVSVASGSQRFDLADEAVRHWFYKSMNADPEVDTTLKNSPTRLIEFSASRLAGDITRIWK